MYSGGYFSQHEPVGNLACRKADAMTDVINALLGPFATVAAVLYLRLALTKQYLQDNKTRRIGAWLCFFVLGYLACFRAAASMGAISPQTARDWMLPMGIPVYGVHMYVAARLTEDAQLRGRMRQEAERQRREVRNILGEMDQ